MSASCSHLGISLAPKQTGILQHHGSRHYGFRDSSGKAVTPGTVNVTLEDHPLAFAQARRDGLIDVNEAERVTLLKRSHDQMSAGLSPWRN